MDSAVITYGETPGARYAQGVAARAWQDDPAQRDVLAAFDRLHSELIMPRARGWRALLHPPRAPPGLYLWGAVGRGKTMLMDLFVDTLPAEIVLRVHFHRFMQDVHARLRDLGRRRDPLREVAAQLAQRARVVCLDEFQVDDIGDAMVLTNLLHALFRADVVLVTTSNTAPAQLYRDGLQRAQFLPAIALLQRYCQVLEMVSPHDWRMRALTRAHIYLTPLSSEAERTLARVFTQLTRGPVQHDGEVTINQRAIPVRRAASGAIWFDFDALCDGPRGSADYLELARVFPTILISEVPQFTPETEDAARRFVQLIDELYDRRVKLIVSAAAPVVDLYDGKRLRAEFARTQSRLIEMQSTAYLAQAHR